MNRYFMNHFKGSMFRWLGCFMVGFLAMGCTHAISDSVRQSTDPSLHFSQVLQSPEDYQGKRVILGGEIVKTTNTANGAEIEIIQKQLDAVGEPYHDDSTGGRFIFLKSGYVEPEIYAKGRYVTGAGTIIGSKVAKLDKTDYTYPVIEVEELHLFEEYTNTPYYGPYYGGYYGWGWGWGGYPYYGGYYGYGPFFPRYRYYW